MINRAFLIIIIVILQLGNAFGQMPADKVLLEKMDLYSKANRSNVLFVHTDKTIYTNNETLWFSAYLLKSESADLKSHTILSVALMREDRSISLQAKYLMQDGLSFGSLNLPDTIPPGNYQFIASTNVLNKLGQPVAVFTQPITLKRITQQNFNATLSLLDTEAINGMIRAKVTIDIKTPGSKENAGVEYHIGKGPNKSAVLNENTYIINIDTSEVNQANPVLFASVKYNTEIQHLNVRLPETMPKRIKLAFFPEGGILVDGLESIVGWETRTSSGLPLTVSGILYKDTEPIDTIRTNSNGIGSFRLKADNKSNYTLKISSNSYLERDTVCILPKALENGIVMHLANAIATDTLRLMLFAMETRTVKVLIHNYLEVYASFQLRVQPSGGRASIALEAIPKGLAMVTVLNEEERPIAERLFFAHYDQRINASIETNKDIYNKKDSVRVRLKLTNKNGNPLNGIVSIAVVQDNRIESSKHRDIETYVYMDDPLENLPEDPQGRGLSNKDYLEDILLVKGWRKYTWQNMMSSLVIDTIRQQVHSPDIKGQVLFKDKPLSKPVEVSVVRDSLFDLITTEIDGSFIWDPDKMVITEGGKILISVNQKKKDGYSFKFEDSFVSINQQLAGQVDISTLRLGWSEKSSNSQPLEGFERTIALKEVTIKAEIDDSLYGPLNTCGDYVCFANILNCPIHAFDHRNRPPIKGKEYPDGRNRDKKGKMIKIIYGGCSHDDKVFNIPGIYTAREFYGVDENSPDLSTPQFLSTLFWRPGEIVKDTSGSVFSFFTGDITGPFRIVVQGVGNGDVIFGEGKFTVK